MKFDGVLKVKLCSSLEKIFPDKKPEVQVLTGSTMLMNEVFSFQAAYMWSGSLLDSVANNPMTANGGWNSSY